MGALVRMVMLVAVAVVPGAFVALCAYVAGRVLVQSWQRASASAAGPDRGARVLREVLGAVSLRDITREARAVLAM
jgi:hypothetical protein